MRGKDVQKFLMVARDMKVTILVRHTNVDSLRASRLSVLVRRERLAYFNYPALRNVGDQVG